MLEGFGGSPAPGAKGGEFTVEPGGMGGQVAFAGSHLVDAACQELGEPHKGVGGEGGSEQVAGKRRGHGGPLAEEDSSGFLLHRRVGVPWWIRGRDRQSGEEMRVEVREGGAAFQEWEDPVSDFVQGVVFADIPLGGLPHEGALCRVKLGKEGAVALGGLNVDLLGTDLCRRPAAGLISGGDKAILRAAMRCRCSISKGRGGRQASMASIGIGVEEKQLVTHL